MKCEPDKRNAMPVMTVCLRESRPKAVSRHTKEKGGGPATPERPRRRSRTTSRQGNISKRDQWLLPGFAVDLPLLCSIASYRVKLP